MASSRYDRLRVKTTEGEKIPYKMSVYSHGRWVSLGTGTDVSVDTTATIKHNGQIKDLLYHPVRHTTDAVWDLTNEVFVAYPRNGYCFCPHSGTAKAGDTVYAKGRGYANSNGGGTVTGNFTVAKPMKVILTNMRGAYPYALNMYNSGTVGSAASVTGWWRTADITSLAGASRAQSRCYIQTYIRKDVDDDVYIFKVWAGNKEWSAIWKKDGHIHVYISDGTKSKTFVSKRAIGAGKLCWFDNYTVKGSRDTYISFCLAEEQKQAAQGDNIQYYDNEGISWTDASADNFIGDALGKSWGKSRLRFAGHILFGGGLQDSGPQECNVYNSDAGWMSDTYLYSANGPHSYGRHTLDQILEQPGTDYYAWE